jgi:hypothetical protein
MSSSLTRPGTAVAAVAVLLALSGATPARAAASTETYAISGAFEIGPPPALTLPPGSTFSFVLDETTGAITDGETSIPAFDRGDASGLEVEVVLRDAAPATGSLDPATGEGEITLTLDGTVSVPSLEVSCALGEPITLTLSTESDGGERLAGDPLSGVLTAYGVAVPPVVEGDACPAEIVDVVNSQIDLPTDDTSFVMAVERVSSEPIAGEPSTELPATGSDTGLVLMAVMMLVGGVVAIAAGRRPRWQR